MVKLQMKIGYCLVCSYFATARNHDVHPLAALCNALAGDTWMPLQTPDQSRA